MYTVKYPVMLRKIRCLLKNLLDFISGTFDHSRLIYASNFPVVELYSNFKDHLNSVREYFHDDPDIFSKNAKKLYKLK